MANNSFNYNNGARVGLLLLVLSLSLYFQNGSCVLHQWRNPVTNLNDDGLSACLQPKFVGPCRARVPKYYYSTVSKKCELFFYGGCEQNNNNFDTFEECSAVCTEKILLQTKEATCTGPAQAGRVHCMAMMQRWTFNTTTKKCEQIVYGGCGATLNNFMSQLDCQLKCVDNSSLSKSKEPWSKYVGSNCEGVKCPGGTSHYKALGCTPIYDDGACCPTRFDCPDRTIQRNSSQCVYDGKLYNIGEAISAADSGSGCRAGCACTMHGINCANVECPSNFGYYPKKDCKIELYKPGQCCAHDFACGNGKNIYPRNCEKTVTCHFEGKNYFEGQKIYPKDEPCLKCYCKPGFNGTLSSNFCEEIDCGIQVWYSTELERGCTPVYFRDSESRIGCCPISWQCPDDYEPKLETNETQIAQPAFAPFVPGPVLTVPDGWQNTTNTSMIEDNIPVDIENKTIDAPTTTTTLHALPIIVLENICNLPKAPGNCRARRRRYFYNNETSQCEEFFYTGCAGNRNNFQLLADCNAECGSQNDLQARFRTIRKPERGERYTDPCTQLVSPGRCRAYFPRFYYDVNSGSCQFFIFGGCHRNDNNFYSKESCEATCLTSYPNICDKKPLDLVKDCGGRNATKFYYDPDLGYCKRFVSSDCGSSNVFDRQIECDSACLGGGANNNRAITTSWRTTVSQEGERDKICMLPKKVGSCYASVPSFYYDVASGQCQPFVYGGCFGNRNRFTSEYECKQTCETPTTTTAPVARDRDLTSISFNERPSSNGLPQPPVPTNHINQRPQGVDLTVLLAATGDTMNQPNNQRPPQVEDPTLMRRGGDATNSAGTITTTTHRSIQQQQQDEEESFIFARMGKTHQHPQVVDDALQKPAQTTERSTHHQSNEEDNNGDSFYKPQVEDPSLMFHKDEDDDDSNFNQQQFKETLSPFSDDNPWLNFTDNFDNQQPQLQPWLNFTPSFDQEVENINPWENFTKYFDNQPEPWLNFTPHFDHQQLQTASNLNQRPQIQPPRSPSTSQQPPRDNRRREMCLENLRIGNCSQTILRFYWDGRSCRPFNYTGCEGNRNQFTTEYECKQTCDDNYHDVSSNLYCQFGHRVIPFGQNLDDNEDKCDTDFCTCIVPPSLTCTWKACPQRQ